MSSRPHYQQSYILSSELGSSKVQDISVLQQPQQQQQAQPPPSPLPGQDKQPSPRDQPEAQPPRLVAPDTGRPLPRLPLPPDTGRPLPRLPLPLPCAGTESRMRCLPRVTHIGVQPAAREPLGPTPSAMFRASQLERPGAAVSRTTYNYEDKYSFVRILRHDELVFDSHFESGNLGTAKRVHANAAAALVPNAYQQEYDLRLNNDVHTNGHVQWYYFSVSNITEGMTVKMNLVNMGKPDSMYNYGMQPLVYSTRMAAGGVDGAAPTKGWHRGGRDVCYYRNDQTRLGRRQHSLTFTYTFVHGGEGEVVYFAYCHPYTYSDLQVHLRTLQDDPERRKTFRRRTLCKTLAGNACDLLVITAPAPTLRALQRRRGVMLTARVHPGESNASWIMKGALDYLTGPSEGARLLREQFVFKVVPMLNPDGVINGNYRCSLAGVDLNRRWGEPDPQLHPTISRTKRMLRRLMAVRDVPLAVDIHGHSRAMDLFLYGCDPEGAAPEVRVFPLMFSKCMPVMNYEGCSFSVGKSKENSARVVIHREGVSNAYTLESSFCGSGGFQFASDDYERMGESLCTTMLHYFEVGHPRMPWSPSGRFAGADAMAAEDGEREGEGGNGNGGRGGLRRLCEQELKVRSDPSSPLHAGRGTARGASSAPLDSDDDPSGDNMDEKERARSLKREGLREQADRMSRHRKTLLRQRRKTERERKSGAGAHASASSEAPQQPSAASASFAAASRETTAAPTATARSRGSRPQRREKEARERRAKIAKDAACGHPPLRMGVAGRGGGAAAAAAERPGPRAKIPVRQQR